MIALKSRLAILLLLLALFLGMLPAVSFSQSCTAGCYKKVGAGFQKVGGFRELSAEEFGYYLPESKCTPKYTDPDEDGSACTCLETSDWYSYGRCCGDDTADCGRVDRGVLCSIDTNWFLADWIPSEPNFGDIRYVGCAQKEFLSTGTDWKKCDGSYWKEKVGNNEYVCAKSGKESIAECCGDEDCGSFVGGKRLKTGEYINVEIYSNGTGMVSDIISNTSFGSNSSNASLSLTGSAIKDIPKFWLRNYELIPSVLAQDGEGGAGDCGTYSCPSPPSPGTAIVTLACSGEAPVVKLIYDTCSTGETEWAIYANGLMNTRGYIASGSEGCKATIEWSAAVPRKLTGLTTVPVPPESNHTYWWDIANPYLAGHPGPYQGSFTTPSCKSSSLVNSSLPAAGCGNLICEWATENEVSCPADCMPETKIINGTNPTCPSGYRMKIRDWESKTLGPLCGAEGGGSCYAPGGWGTYPSLGDSTYCCISGCHRCDSEVSKIYTDLVIPMADSGKWGWKSVECEKIIAPKPLYICPNSVCESGENHDTCPQDCGEPKNITLYCTPEGTFAEDLDLKEEEIADKVLLASRKKTCEKAGLTWTGTKCCSEKNDQNEYYNDPSGKGACWNKQPVLNFDSAPNTNDSVASYNGQFHGCAIDKSVYNPENDWFLELKDNFTSESLIENHPYCFTDPLKSFYCSFFERWEPSDGANFSHISFSPLANASRSAECCAANSCWDGNACVANQKFNPLAKPLDSKYLCIDGNWTISSYKCAPDTAICTGFCPDDSQCLVSVFSTNGSACIKSDEYVNDNYCQNGNWSTRTKLLAVQLMNLRGSGDYSLYCDKKENSLNNLNYLSEDKQLVSSLLAGSPANNFCVLRAANKTIIGTTLNRDLDAFPKSTLSVFRISNCSSVTLNDYEYHQCDSSNKAWYSKGLKSVIFSQSPISLAPLESEGFFRRVILGPIKKIIFSLNALNTTPPYDNSYLDSIKKFDKLYMSQKGNRTVKASIDGLTFKNFVGEYSGFSSDICKAANEYHKARGDGLSGISCRKDSAGSYYVLAQGSSSVNVNPEIIWPDLTAKLRYK